MNLIEKSKKSKIFWFFNKFIIVTNRFDLSAEEISDIYRLRWSIETFFKWIKQHLVIKKFYSTSFNGILIQIYTALILYCLLKLIHILYCKKFDFLKMVRLISDGLFNTLEYLIQCLTPTKPPPIQKRFNWKKEYLALLAEYNLTDDFCWFFYFLLHSSSCYGTCFFRSSFPFLGVLSVICLWHFLLWFALALLLSIFITWLLWIIFMQR